MEKNELQEALSDMLKPLFDIVKEEKPKFWYDPYTNRTGFQTYKGKFYSKCRDEDTYDKYVGCALCIAKELFGGNKKFREFVDKHWVGRQPYGYEPKKWESPFVTGDRVLFLLDGTNMESIGTILAIDNEKQRYIINAKDKELIVHHDEIIRKCRKANKPKELTNETKETI